MADHTDELACLKSALADCLRRLSQVESQSRAIEAASGHTNAAFSHNSSSMTKSRGHKTSAAATNSTSKRIMCANGCLLNLF